MSKLRTNERCWYVIQGLSLAKGTAAGEGKRIFLVKRGTVLKSTAAYPDYYVVCEEHSGDTSYRKRDDVFRYKDQAALRCVELKNTIVLDKIEKSNG